MTSSLGSTGFACKRRVADTVAAVFTHGAVGSPAVEWLLGLLDEAYGRGGGPGYVELHVYSSLSLLRAALSREEEREGVLVAADYPVAHEAWTGVPRIHVALAEGVYGLPKPEAEALIVHEAIHAVLHGSPEYYLVPVTGSLLAAYTAATALKDLEVHIEMKKRSLTRHLYGLQAYWLRTYGGELPCTTSEDIFNTLKASTVWIALRQQPPLARQCSKKLRKPLDNLSHIARQYQQGKVRPWHLLGEYTKLIEETLNSITTQAVNN
ncbi:hypothetical protein [Hyperthermus butylicus]|uniref:Uncharacterized protein n=1 Tax=Hyperthermus butylicus (strain DSM 5456 / JCM 9403 / PLM1-5) TaxID=415426 RepID=A2BKM2_HYPBU|nr:hypothetical protein [Hyperthermus butylicus]ABM80533.1 hypothetical protein Hbut_0677 [Hyperthermus butylicus DSM 5456]